MIRQYRSWYAIRACMVVMQRRPQYQSPGRISSGAHVIPKTVRPGYAPTIPLRVTNTTKATLYLIHFIICLNLFYLSCTLRHMIKLSTYSLPKHFFSVTWKLNLSRNVMHMEILPNFASQTISIFYKTLFEWMKLSSFHWVDSVSIRLIGK